MCIAGLFGSSSPPPPPPPKEYAPVISRKYEEAHKEVMNYKAGDPVKVEPSEPDTKDEVRIQPVDDIRRTAKQQRTADAAAKESQSRHELAVKKASGEDPAVIGTKKGESRKTLNIGNNYS